MKSALTLTGKVTKLIPVISSGSSLTKTAFMTGAMGAVEHMVTSKKNGASRIQTAAGRDTGILGKRRTNHISTER